MARLLKEQGIGRNMPVIVCMEKSVNMIITLLAVMKSGGAYIPIETNWPKERIEYVIDNAQAKYLIYDSNNAYEDNDLQTKTKSFNELEIVYQELDDTAVQNINKVTDLAYIVYTSGSTGRPKGVMVSHKNVVSIYQAWENAYELKTYSFNHLQMASFFSFDVFSGDLVRGLCSGGKLVLCRKEILLNIPLLYNIMEKEEVNIGEFVPAIIRNMMNYIRNSGKRLNFMKTIVVGSDMWNMDEFRTLKFLCAKHTRVISSYGLTEATIDSTYYEPHDLLTNEGPVPIGKPFSNTEVYILDHHMNPVPVGVPGEIYIGGDGVAIGYVNEPELTQERFVTNAFGEGRETRLYKTGDLATWDIDGNIKLLQRVDNQVKIRGHRIELTEIEKYIESITEIEKAFVLAKEAINGEKILCAYYKLLEGTYEAEKVNKYLKKKKFHPIWCLPTSFK